MTRDGRSEVAARAVAPDDNPPAEIENFGRHGDGIVDTGGEGVLGCEAVVDAHDLPPGEVAGGASNRVGRVDVTEDPPAAVQPYKREVGGSAGQGPVPSDGNAGDGVVQRPLLF